MCCGLLQSMAYLELLNFLHGNSRPQRIIETVFWIVKVLVTQSSDSLWPQWTVALQAPLSMGFFRNKYQSGFPCPPPSDLPDPGIEPTFLASPALEDRYLPLRRLRVSGTRIPKFKHSCNIYCLCLTFLIFKIRKLIKWHQEGSHEA